MFSKSVALAIVTPFVNYCNMCFGKLFQYALNVFEGCTLFYYIDRTRNNWQKTTILSINASMETTE